jgi:hypothetical protein
MISVSKDTPIPKKAENVTEAFIDWCDSIYIANESTSNIDKIIIDIFGKEYSITADFSNYSKSGEMTGSQRASYNNFESAKQKILKDVENKLKGYNKDASKIYTPALLKIKKDGELAIAFDEKDNSEGGIVVVILPKMGLLAPDQYF